MQEDIYDFVLDCSVTMAWCFEDEGNQFTDAILEDFTTATAVVPTIWPLEVANVLLIAKKKKRITPLHTAHFNDALSALPIVVHWQTTQPARRFVWQPHQKI